jgi:transcriptional regulator with XRE-family HTH domain
MIKYTTQEEKIMSAYLQQQIEDRMMAKNLTIYALEKKAGLNRNAVRNILRGFSKNPSVEILSAIARTLDCTLNDLVGTNDGNSSAVPHKPLTKAAFKNKVSYVWKESLYFDAVKTIANLISKNGESLNLEQVTNLINETYKYSISKDSDTVDKDFCKWLIGKNL